MGGTGRIAHPGGLVARGAAAAAMLAVAVVASITVSWKAGAALALFIAVLAAFYFQRGVVGELAKASRPYWWPLLLLFALSFAIIANDQARDLLESAAIDANGDEMAALFDAPSDVGLTNSLGWLLVATAYFSFTTWTFLRLASEFEPVAEGRIPPAWRNLLRLQAARFAGIALPLVLAGRYLQLGSADGWLVGNAYLTESLLFAALALALFLVFWLRRVVFDREPLVTALLGLKPVIKPEGRIKEGAPRIWLGVLLAGHVLLLALFTVVDRFDNPGRLGAPAIVVFAFSGFLAVGWLLFTYLPHRTGWPAIPVFFAGWTALTSIWNDNHAIRTLSPPAAEGDAAPAAHRPPVDADDYARAWLLEREALMEDCDFWPIFVVAAEGGGVRAAYWTGTVLGSLEKETRALATEGCGSFADHVFMISGVSGGALGASAFAAAIRDGWNQGVEGDPGRNPERAAARFLSHDFLSPSVAAMLYPDSMSRLWPFDGDLVARADRARWMEGAWEERWAEVLAGVDDPRPEETPRSSFARDYRELWAEGRIADVLDWAAGRRDRPAPETGQREPAPPVLAINTTSVQTGAKWVLGPVRFESAEAQLDLGRCDSGQFEDLGAPPISLATATHLSARFTFISPAARVETRAVCPEVPDPAATGRDGRPGAPPTEFMRFVDGGYFEDSGAHTASEAVDALIRVLLELRDACPRSGAPASAYASARPLCKAGVVPLAITTETTPPQTRPPVFAPEMRSPLSAVMAARGARGVAARRLFSVSGDVIDADGRVVPHAIEGLTADAAGSAAPAGATEAVPVAARVGDDDPSLYIDIHLPRRWGGPCPNGEPEPMDGDELSTPFALCDRPENARVRLLPLGWTLAKWSVARMDEARERQLADTGCGRAVVLLVEGANPRDVLRSVGATQAGRCEGIRWGERLAAAAD